ncbi:MAG: hypothetical protein Q9184_000940 [Pyrenodesmia sp. 2 TL-2023]
MAFNAKNLTYGCSPMHVAGIIKLTCVPESNEPAFLRKLKGEYGGTDPARHHRPLARPKKVVHTDEENDNDPVYVKETDPHEPMSKADYDALLKAATTNQSPANKAQPGETTNGPDEIAPPPEPTPERPVSQYVVIGAASKKRSVKIVGENDLSDRPLESTDEPGTRAKSKGQQRAKRPKLSFQDPQGI